MGGDAVRLYSRLQFSFSYVGRTGRRSHSRAWAPPGDKRLGPFRMTDGVVCGPDTADRASAARRWMWSDLKRERFSLPTAHILQTSILRQIGKCGPTLEGPHVALGGEGMFPYSRKLGRFS